MTARRVQLAVIGAGQCDEALYRAAFATGQRIAEAGATLVCGGRSGVMAAASAGARNRGGLTVGILPGVNAQESPPNPDIQVALFTGIGQARNQVVVLSAAAVIAIGGGWGTLSEIALALKHRVPVVVLNGWQLQRPDGREEPLLLSATDPLEAVNLAVRASRHRPD
jgi:uncharacterized protein (TIGR00725 family)